MPHRTLNPTTAFYGDMREQSFHLPRPGRNKYRESKQIWSLEFEEPYPHFFGSAKVAYARLEQAGWKWSSRHGWRKCKLGDGA